MKDFVNPSVAEEEIANADLLYREVTDEMQRYINRSVKSDDVLYREGDLEEVNERFNEELDNLTEENADKVIMSLGMPSDILLAAGVVDKPMKLYGNKVIKKMKKHGFKLDELRNLPEAVANPIAVFDNYQKGDGSRSVLTELNTKNGNFLVALSVGKGEDIDFNIVSSVFGKEEGNVVDWIERRLAKYIDKEKALNYLHHSALSAEALSNSRLLSATKVVKDFVNPSVDSGNLREGDGAYTNDELSYENAPIAKVTGKQRETAQSMAQTGKEVAEKLHLDNVDIVTDTANLEGKQKYAKGFYNTKTGKITIVVPNHRDAQDVIMTVLHEAVGHKGLRHLVGDKEMDKFTMAIYKNSDKETRDKILALANKHGWRIGVAVEEYIAEQAESINFDNKLMQFFTKIAELLVELLDKVGIHIGKPMSLRDTRWLLWQSYNNIDKSDVFLNAKRAVIASRLGYDYKSQAEEVKANQETRYREAEDQMLNSAAEMYNSAIKSGWSYLREAYQDQYAPVEKLVDAIAKQTGKKMESWENPLYAMNTLSSINLEEKKTMIRKYLEPMWNAISQMQKQMNVTMDDINMYTQLKSGLERNDVFAKRDAKQAREATYRKSIGSAKAEYEESIKEAQKIDDTSERTDFIEKAKAKLEESLAKAKEKLEGDITAINSDVDPLYLKNRDRDYSGLMSWFSKTDNISPKRETETEEAYLARVKAATHSIYDSLKEAEEAAIEFVEGFEERANGLTELLWNNINNANIAVLDHQLNAGIISRKLYDHLTSMMKYYVPLRGFEDTTAEDLYTYFNKSAKPGLASPVIKAEGRKSKAENPFSWMATMLESAIQIDNKNRAKLALYYFISRRPNNDLASISQTWYEQTGEYDENGKPIYEEVYPELTDDMNSAEVAEAVSNFEAEMKQKKLKVSLYKVIKPFSFLVALLILTKHPNKNILFL